MDGIYLSRPTAHKPSWMQLIGFARPDHDWSAKFYTVISDLRSASGESGYSFERVLQ